MFDSIKVEKSEKQLIDLDWLQKVNYIDANR